jgi:hypothetical protein
MQDFFWYLITFSVGWYLGKQWAYTTMTMLMHRVAKMHKIDLDKTFDKIQNDLDEEDVKEPSIQVYTLCIETHDDVMYLYDGSDFICQGKTLDELAKFAKEYKNIDYAAVLFGDKIIKFHKGTHES